MDNPKTLAEMGTQDEDKQTKLNKVKMKEKKTMQKIKR
jgi:hypothetical protein